jgi:23S rRNA pseudouridine955/2504/2580 synthase
MATFRTISVGKNDVDKRLDRWFREYFPGTGFGELQKLLRTGQVRVDGKRAKANLRLEEGQQVRVPPQAQSGIAASADEHAKRPPKVPAPVKESDAKALKSMVFYRDEAIIVLNKPAGLAVQGGTKTFHHLDGMLDALTFDADERPRLVHRLDRDTSGILVLARTRVAAQALTKAFRARETRKIYLAVTAGVPRPHQGKIDLALGKDGARGREKMKGDARDSRSAATLYAVLDTAGQKASLVSLMPLTGRTHQLRAHMAAIETPIMGDGKYGGSKAFITGVGLEKRLHLHAYRLEIPKPDGGLLSVEAPLPVHMRTAVAAFGFDTSVDPDPFPRESD